MSTLLVGFDSAWTDNHSGALVGVLRNEDGKYQYIGKPEVADFPKASKTICGWQQLYDPKLTLILIDQPIIVRNEKGQRQVEKIVSPIVGRLKGGMQPANTSKKEMFGEDAPVWSFLCRFGFPADPLNSSEGTMVFETYPVLTIITLNWLLNDKHDISRLPKYNPERKTFSICDWKHVRQNVSSELGKHGLEKLVDDVIPNDKPRKHHQDMLDACICLLVALYLSENKDCLMVGDMTNGYIVVPCNKCIYDELKKICCREKIQLNPSECVLSFHLT